MLLNMDHNIKIALRSTANPSLAVARGTETRPIRNSRRNFQFDSTRSLHPPLAVAAPAWFFDDVTNSATPRTSLRHLKKSARADYLAATAANWAIDRVRTTLGTGTFAFVADIELSNFDFFFSAGGCFLKRDLHVITQIGAPLAIFPMSADATEKGFENVPADSSAAKDLAKNIERIVEPSAKSPALLESGVTKTVVSGAFVAVHQHIVSLAKLLELFFSVRVVRILIRMKFHSQLAISALDLFNRRGALNFEHLVIIALLGRHLEIVTCDR